ncbi:hypothetical protein K443DRAFT_124793 [Laccaria amethystina LaAM-08-1]|uniref:Uncharacterized protein n=1 Tax=Laccaria amethystina LaAM-08-1 TaxID=1095629 RepID=A0A0C9X2V5_9AGAR|nr:hypothetical protein K443DRAFT_124793 [Laccaria amethystina LaAM-08-1]
MARKQKKTASEPLLPTAKTKADDKRLTNILHRALVIFTNEFPARELFAAENEAEIAAAMEDIRKAEPQLLGGALRNKALGQLWGKTDREFTWASDDNVPTIPWSALSSNPDDYYDTKQFNLPIPLLEPDLYLNPLSDAAALIGYFTTLSTTEKPFCFRSKEEIVVRIDKRMASKQDLGQHQLPAPSPTLHPHSATSSRMLPSPPPTTASWSSTTTPATKGTSNPTTISLSSQPIIPPPTTTSVLTTITITPTATIEVPFATTPPPPNISSQSAVSTSTAATPVKHSNLASIPPPPNILSPSAVSTSTTTIPAGHSDLASIPPPPNVLSPSAVSTSTTTAPATIISNLATIPPLPNVLSPSALSKSITTIPARHSDLSSIPPPPNVVHPSTVSTSTTTTPATIVTGLSDLAQGTVEGPSGFSQEALLAAQVLLQNRAKGHERKMKAKTGAKRLAKRLVTPSELRISGRKRKQPEPDPKKPGETLTKKRKTKGSWFWHNPITDSYFDQDNNPVDKNGDRLNDN